LTLGRVLGVDLGERRIGLALSDPLGITASPLAVLERTGDRAADHRAIVAAARDAGAERIVVGLPRSLAGGEGPAARAVREEIEAIAALGLPVEAHDERLTTVMAERVLSAGGVRGRARRQRVDKVAAAVILQSWLDGRRPG
jgi:putative Holliday junction resolvase